jgi:hypothetical protein
VTAEVRKLLAAFAYTNTMPSLAEVFVALASAKPGKATERKVETLQKGAVYYK